MAAAQAESAKIEKAIQTLVASLNAKRTSLLVAKGENDPAVQEIDQQIAVIDRLHLPSTRVNALIQPKRSFPTDAGQISSGVFSPDGKMLAVADWEGKIRVYDFATGSQRFEIVLDRRPSGQCRFLAVSPDGATIAAVGTDQTIRVIDVATGRIRQAWHGSPHPYNAVAFSPDGKTLAAGGCGPDGRGGLLELWERASGKADTVDFAEPVRSLAFPPGHPEWLAVGTDGDGVRMVDVPSAKMKYTMRQSNPVRAIAFAPDGQWIAASAGDNQVHFGTTSNGWRTVVHKGIDLLTGHTGRVTSINVSPDGKLMVTASLDGTAKIWEVRRRKCLETFVPGTYKSGMGVSMFTPDGKSVVTAGDDGMIRVWDVKPFVVGNPGHTTPTAKVPVLSDIPILGDMFQNKVAQEREKAEAARAQAEANLQAAKAAEAKAQNGLQMTQPKRSFPTAVDIVSSAVFSPDGKILFVADMGGGIQAYDPATGQKRLAITGPEAGRYLAISPDGKTLASGGTDASAVRLWDARTGKQIRALSHDQVLVHGLAFSPGGKSLVVAGGSAVRRSDGSADGKVILWDLSQATARTVTTRAWALSAAFPPDHNHWLAVGTDGPNIRIVDLSRATVEYTLDERGPIGAMAFSPDGQRLAASSGDQVRLWDWQQRSGPLADLHTGHSGRVTSVQYSPDGNWLVTASLDGTAKLWDLRLSQCAATFAPGTYKSGMSVALFTPDGQSIITAGDDGQIRVWDVTSTIGKTATTTTDDSDLHKELGVKKAMAAERSRRLAAEATPANKVGDGMRATHPQGTFQTAAGGPILSAAFAPRRPFSLRRRGKAAGPEVRLAKRRGGWRHDWSMGRCPARRCRPGWRDNRHRQWPLSFDLWADG